MAEGVHRSVPRIKEHINERNVSKDELLTLCELAINYFPKFKKDNELSNNIRILFEAAKATKS
ncbi:MAG: hypothetical protein ABH821_05375 [archaeon]